MSGFDIEIEALLPWIEASFSRSPGPGGQNVNKLNTRVTLLFDIEACTLLDPMQKARIRSHLKTRLSRDRRLRVVAHRERTQVKNRSRAQDRLIELLSEALRTQKRRRPTRPSKGSKKRRLQAKRQRSETKQRRRSVQSD